MREDFIDDLSTSTPKKHHSPVPSYASTPIRKLLPDADLSMAVSDCDYPPDSELTTTLDHLMKKNIKTSR